MSLPLRSQAWRLISGTFADRLSSWGADHSLQFNAHVLTTVIVDFDGGEVGPFMQRLGAEARSAEGKKTLGFVNEPGSKYGGSVEAVRHALKQEDFWIAIFILSNATSTMNYAYENGNSSYDPSGSIQAYYEEGRNTLVLAEFALPILQNLLSTFVLEFAKQKQRNLTAANSGNAAALERQTAIPIPIAYSLYNEAPAVPSTAEAATEIGTICECLALEPIWRLMAFRSHYCLIRRCAHVRRSR